MPRNVLMFLFFAIAIGIFVVFAFFRAPAGVEDEAETTATPPAAEVVE